MEQSSYLPLVEALERAPRIVVPLVRELAEPLRKRRPSPGKWSAHEHACHLAAVQPMFFERLTLMLEQQHPTIRPYLPEQEHAEDALLRIDLDDALRRFSEQRAELVARLRGLRPEDWDRSAEHPEYSRYSVFVLFRHAALHDALHAYRIEELVLKRDWS
jgi:uncharacterized damage-inducible protein DinB